jgi:hypothetical protein
LWYGKPSSLHYSLNLILREKQNGWNSKKMLTE